MTSFGATYSFASSPPQASSTCRPQKHGRNQGHLVGAGREHIQGLAQVPPGCAGGCSSRRRYQCDVTWSSTSLEEGAFQA